MLVHQQIWGIYFVSRHLRKLGSPKAVNSQGCWTWGRGEKKEMEFKPVSRGLPWLLGSSWFCGEEECILDYLLNNISEAKGNLLELPASPWRDLWWGKADGQADLKVFLFSSRHYYIGVLLPIHLVICMQSVVSELSWTRSRIRTLALACVVAQICNPRYLGGWGRIITNLASCLG